MVNPSKSIIKTLKSIASSKRRKEVTFDQKETVIDNVNCVIVGDDFINVLTKIYDVEACDLNEEVDISAIEMAKVFVNHRKHYKEYALPLGMVKTRNSKSNGVKYGKRPISSSFYESNSSLNAGQAGSDMRHSSIQVKYHHPVVQELISPICDSEEQEKFDDKFNRVSKYSNRIKFFMKYKRKNSEVLS